MKLSTYLVVPAVVIATAGFTGLSAEAAQDHQPLFTDNQREELKDMREDGASREEIKDQLQDWGIDFSILKKRRGHRKAIFEQLSEDQKEELKEMREDGASREEIKDQLQDWGIETPERKNAEH